VNTNGTDKKCSLYGGVHYIEVSARRNSYMYAMQSGRKSDGYNILFQSESSLISASSERSNYSFIIDIYSISVKQNTRT
jgi:hypothetical protein